MTPRPLSADYAVAPQLSEADLETAASLGFRTIIDARPDGEDPGQPLAETLRARAEALGLAFAHVPVVPGAITQADVAAFADARAALPSPALGFCRSGARAASLWERAQGS